MRIINLLADQPAYESLVEPNLLLREWELSDSERSPNGNSNREWPAQLGPWVLAQRPDWNWEVWQPDTNADRVYTHVFDDGVVHRLFPSEKQTHRVGVRSRWALRSRALLARLQAERCQPYLLVLHGLGPSLWWEVLEHVSTALEVPTYLIGHGSAYPLTAKLRMTRNPLRFVEVLADHLRTRRAFARLDGMSAPDDLNAAAGRSVFRGRIDRLTMGCDFNFWVPAPDMPTRQAARTGLGIPAGRTLFLTVGRLSPSKRVDALLRAFRPLGDRRDFTLLVVGQGEPAYVDSLRQAAGTLLEDGRVIFHSHATGADLRRLYWAADYFVSGSRSEGGPVTIMEAMACGVPVIATPVGRTCEVMGGFGSGTLALTHPHSWTGVLRAALDHRYIQPLDRKVARDHFDWRMIARKLVDILSEVVEQRWAKSELQSARYVAAGA